MNGDGFEDVLIGAPYRDSPTNSGATYLVLGPPPPGLHSLEQSHLVLRGSTSSDYFGWSVAGGADLDGDGAPDFAVGASDADPNGSSSGSVYVFYGCPN